MDRVYLIKGFTGEYGDRCDWIVAAYPDRAEAERHLKRLEELLGPAMFSLEPYQREELQERIRESGLDSRCLIQYTGSRYGVQEVALSVFAPGRPQPARRTSALAE
jgi:hypothetical protein